MLNVPCESGTCCARHVLDAARAQQWRDALEALHARPWVDVAEERVLSSAWPCGERQCVACLLHRLQAPHAYAVLADARVQTAGHVASRLHAVADLEVLGKAR